MRHRCPPGTRSGTATTLWIIAATTLLGSSIGAQDLAGVWQGTAIAAGRPYRQVLRISKSDSAWRVVHYSIDETADPVAASHALLQGGNLTLQFPPNSTTSGAADYRGKLSADARSLTGTWTDPDGNFPLNFRKVAPKDAWPVPPSHTVQFIPVDTNVKLEVLDWGGSGRPIVFLTGLGNNAHVFDLFAPQFTPRYHVYGITRRGYGESSHPVPDGHNYSADRLGDDVLAVLDSLRLVRPVLVGHSIAGEELSSIGSRHPDRVSGLVYLDAGYSYAFYNQARGDMSLDLISLLKELEDLRPGKGPVDARPVIQQLLDTSLPQFQRDLKDYKEELDALPPALLKAYDSVPLPDATPRLAITSSEEKYTRVAVPILAVYAEPHGAPPEFAIKDSAARAASDARDSALVETQAAAFAAANSTVHLVRLRHADHYVFISNAADVVREMNAFLTSLPQ
jgi:pimeloyl-ACP methyl ester carboxylesterase